MSDKVLYGVCVNARLVDGLREGKVYRLVEGFVPSHYSVVDDYGAERVVLKSRFEVTTVASPDYTVPDVFSVMAATSTQVGGSHYASRKFQPIDYIMENGLDFCEGNVVKYVTRYRDKGGIEDLRKARHYLDFLIEREEKKQ